MNFRFHWGMGIALFIGIFVISMLAMVISTLDHRWELVRDDYYESDLKFDQKAEKIRNARVFGNGISIKVTDLNQVEMHFDHITDGMVGNIHFFRPSNQALDFIIPLKLDAEQKQRVKSMKLQSGKWKVMTEWQDDSGKGFYNEQVLVIP